LTNDKYITASCTISDGVIQKDGEVVVANSSAALSDLLVSAYQNLDPGYPKFHKMDNLSKLGWFTAEVLLKDIPLNEKYQPENIGLVLANKNSSLDTDLKFNASDIEVRSPSVFVYTLPNIVMGEICIRHNLKGEQSFFIKDNFDADLIFRQVSYLLDQKILEACICGWVDVLGEEYKAALYLIETSDNTESIVFSPDNLNNIFNNSKIDH
jgi:hypothetical protein